jgi:hypothetical protein
MTMHASTDPESTPAPRAGKPWRTALAGLLLLGVSGGMMAYGAPSRASTLPHSHAESALVSATLPQRVYAKSMRAELAWARPVPGTPALAADEVR